MLKIFSTATVGTCSAISSRSLSQFKKTTLILIENEKNSNAKLLLISVYEIHKLKSQLIREMKMLFLVKRKTSKILYFTLNKKYLHGVYKKMMK